MHVKVLEKKCPSGQFWCSPWSYGTGPTLSRALTLQSAPTPKILIEVRICSDSTWPLILVVLGAQPWGYTQFVNRHFSTIVTRHVDRGLSILISNDRWWEDKAYGFYTSYIMKEKRVEKHKERYRVMCDVALLLVCTVSAFLIYCT